MNPPPKIENSIVSVICEILNDTDRNTPFHMFRINTHLVRLISTNFTRIRDVETMKFVQPVRDWLSIPTQGQILK